MKKTIYNLAVLSAFTLLFFSCSSDDDTPTPKIGDQQQQEEEEEEVQPPYALITRVEAGSASSYNYYAQSFNELDENTDYDNQSAVEIFASGGAGVSSFGGSIFVNEYINTQSITKWTPNVAGVFSNAGSISIAEVGFQGNICFKDENTAFIGGPSASKIVIFDPSTMQKTGYIDFSSFSRLGEVTDYPEAGNTINMEAPVEMIIRDNKLFVAFFLIQDFNTYTPATSASDMLIIDLAMVNATSTDNSEAIVKWISDERGVSIGAWNSGAGAEFIIKDENDDIYLLCHNFWGGTGALTGKPNCILRIKNGETDFDPDYYFDLEAVSIGDGNPVINLEYAGNGLFFAAAINNSAVNPDDPYSYYLDPISQWYRFNLYDKTAQIVSDELTKGSWAAITYSENGKIYIPYQTATESFVKEVDVNSLENSNLFTTVGTPILYKVK